MNPPKDVPAEPSVSSSDYFCSVPNQTGAQGGSQGLPDLPVPQDVDEGVDQGCEDSVEEGEHLAELLQWGCSRQDIDNKEGAKENGNNGEVRGLSGEGLLPTHNGGGPQDGSYDAHVGGQCEQEGEDHIQEAEYESNKCGHAGVTAGRLQQRGEITEEVVDCPGATEL